MFASDSFLRHMNNSQKKNPVCGIYKITSPTGKVYIGQSRDADARRMYYEKAYCKTQPKLYASIAKHGWGTHRFDVIHLCQERELNSLEIYYIAMYDSTNKKGGLNLTHGGEGCRLTEDGINKMRHSLRGKPSWNKGLTGIYSEATKEKMRLAKRGNVAPNSGQFIGGVSSWNKGISPTAKSIDQMRKSKLGAVVTKEHRNKISAALKLAHASGRVTPAWRGKTGKNHNRSKPINQYTVDGVFIRSWESSTSVARELNISSGNISSCCLGLKNRPTAGGFIWKFTNPIK